MSAETPIERRYDEPRLRMTLPGRAAVRTISLFVYGLLAAGAVISSLSEVSFLRSAGWITLLFLGDRLLHVSRADRSLYRLPRHGKVNEAEYVAPAAYRTIETAFDRASVHGFDLTLSLVFQLIRRKEIAFAFRRLEVPLEQLLQKLEGRLEQSRNIQPKSDALRVAAAIISSSFNAARRMGFGDIEPFHLMLGVMAVKHEGLEKLWQLFDVSSQDVLTALFLAHSAHRASPLRRARRFLGFGGHRRRTIMNRAWTAKPTYFLDRVSEDVTGRALSGDGRVLVGHEKEYRRFLEVLTRPGSPDVLLVGDPGVSKESLVRHLAYQMVTDAVPAPLYDHRLVSIDVGALLAGAPPEELEARVKKIVAEIEDAGNVVLYIPDIHNLFKASGEGRINALDVLIPAIKDAAFSVIGSTYPLEYKRFLEPQTEFLGTFEVIRLEEVSEAETLELLTYFVPSYEAQYGITINVRALKQAVSLAHRYFHDKRLPGSAEDLLREAIAAAAGARKTVVSPEDVTRSAEEKVHVPMHKAQEDEVKALLHFEETIHQKFIDQEEAVRAIGQVLREYRAGLARRGGPVASFLFIGPTGVGKTELAKILAEWQFGSAESFIRFDMSEYQDRESVYRLIGSPDGKTRGELTEAVIEKPFSVVLLDEFEKANTDILNLFLPVLDDGRLTDNLERVVDFKNTIIIATSNAHSDIVKEALDRGESATSVAGYLKSRLTDVFKPELLNRFSRIIVFKNLEPPELEAIAEINLREITAALRDQGIEIVFDRPVTGLITKLGYDPAFGARPLRQVIEDKVRSVVAELILKGEVKRGDALRAELEGETIIFKVQHPV